MVNPSLYERLPFDVEKDLVPVTKTGASPNSWLVNQEFSAKTMNELIDLMRANPGKYSVASPGTGCRFHRCRSKCSSRASGSASSLCHLQAAAR